MWSILDRLDFWRHKYETRLAKKAAVRISLPCVSSYPSTPCRMTSKAEDDVYLSQLRDVFDSCDTSGTGYLGRGDLKLLCGKLQLGDTADLLGTRLLGEEGEARVGVVLS